MTALYLKYRPQKLNELDLTSVREQLTKIVKSGKIPHALLFSGPRGSGKTSAARILAKVINCSSSKSSRKGGEPCNRCKQCKAITTGTSLDVIELDAASNRGIDDVRNLREKVSLAPTTAAKKIYILDEAHMLTTEAANALLKTLEEPPEHVIFILATTNPEKLPETVRSRVTQIVFEKASPAEIKRQLTRVMRGEKLTAEKGVVEAIARASDGSFRDAVKILEELSRGKKKIKKKATDTFLFEVEKTKTGKLLEALFVRDAKRALSLIEEAVNSGVRMKNYIDNLLSSLREAFLVKEGFEGEDITDFKRDELIILLEMVADARAKISTAYLPQLPLEIAVCKWCHQFEPGESGIESPIDSEPEETEEKNAKQEGHHARKVSQLDSQAWEKILSGAHLRDTRLEALLRAARPMGFDGETLEVGVYYQFHKERLESQTVRQVLEEVIAEVIGCPTRVVYNLTQKDEAQKALTETIDEDIIEAAKDIFS